MKPLAYILLPLIQLSCSSPAESVSSQEEPIRIEDMNEVKQRYGIVGKVAPELRVPTWVDGEGVEMDAPSILDGQGKLRILYCFQSWCPGCHSVGLPSLQKIVKAFEGNDQIEFLAIQTVFEGFEANTYEKMIETQQKYDLHIPFGHDVGSEKTSNRSSTMYDYRTGGTPWFIFINRQGKVIFNDFHVDTEKAIDFLKQETKEE